MATQYLYNNIIGLLFINAETRSVWSVENFMSVYPLVERLHKFDNYYFVEKYIFLKLFLCTKTLESCIFSNYKNLWVISCIFKKKCFIDICCLFHSAIEEQMFIVNYKATGKSKNTYNKVLKRQKKNEYLIE